MLKSACFVLSICRGS